MQWVSVSSTASGPDEAVAECFHELDPRLASPPDLVLVFASVHHAKRFSTIAAQVAAAHPQAHVVGCVARGVVGGGKESEDVAAVSITAASLPDVDVSVLEVGGGDTGDQAAWLRKAVELAPSALAIIMDAASVDPDQLVATLDSALPRTTKFGGFVSGDAASGANLLMHGDRVLTSGALLVSFGGDIRVDTVVAQGCKPIGRPMTVTRHQSNLVLSVDDSRPDDALRALFDELPETDRRLLPTALNIGIQLSDGGEFLVRPVLGIDPNSGAVATTEKFRGGEVVRFYLRESAASSADLRDALERIKPGVAEPAGALLFSCIGRGIGLFGTSNHDSDLIRDVFGDLEVGGFFCAGEIGPVGNSTFIHGYTSTVAFFRPGDES